MITNSISAFLFIDGLKCSLLILLRTVITPCLGKDGYMFDMYMLNRPSGAKGQGVVSPPPKKILLVCPFFRRALEMPLMKEVTKNVHEN